MWDKNIKHRKSGEKVFKIWLEIELVLAILKMMVQNRTSLLNWKISIWEDMRRYSGILRKWESGFLKIMLTEASQGMS